MRTFSENEARAVFARAAREQQAASDAGASDDGLTLDELQEIGRASGLDPAFVAAAAAGLRAAPAREAPTLLGMPTELKRTRVLPSPLSDAAWEQTVEALRAQFGGPGVTSQIGRVREWTSPPRSGVSSGYTIHVSVRPRADGQSEVTAEHQGLKQNIHGLVAASGTFAAVAVLMLGLMIALPFNPGVVAMAVIFGSFGLLFGIGGVLGMRAHARRLDARFEAALDRIERIARTEAPAPSVALEAPDLGDDATVRDAVSHLGLDALGEEPDAETQRSASPRTRA